MNIKLDVLREPLSLTLVDATFSAAKAPRDAVLCRNDRETVPAALCDAYSLIVRRATDGIAVMGPERPASIAAALGHVGILESLANVHSSVLTQEEKYSDSAGSLNTRCPSFWAAYYGRSACLDFFAECGVSLEPIWQGIVSSVHDESVEWLLRHERARTAKIVDRLMSREKPTEIAASTVLRQALAYAIKCSSVPQLRNKSLGSIETLVNKGKIDLNKPYCLTPDDDGNAWMPETPLQEAPEGWLAHAIKVEHAFDAAELMLRLGAPTALILEEPAKSVSARSVRKLFHLKSDSHNQADGLWEQYASRGTSLLHKAIEASHLELISTFLEKGAQVTNEHFMSALGSTNATRIYATLHLHGHLPNTLKLARQYHEEAKAAVPDGEDVSNDPLVILIKSQVDLLGAKKRKVKAAVLQRWTQDCLAAAKLCVEEEEILLSARGQGSDCESSGEAVGMSSEETAQP